MDRRTFATVAVTPAAFVALAGCSDNNNESPSYESWLEDVENYDNLVDKTDEEEVDVAVGAGSNGLLFDPPAIEISNETTVYWIWTGEGGRHNVEEVDGAFESDLVSDEGHEFEHVFNETGVYNYKCTPHEDAGMKGSVVVE